jgi:signal transduction histidine kinase
MSGIAMAVSELAQAILPSGLGVSVGWAVIVFSVLVLGPAGTAWVQFIGSTVTGGVRRTSILPFMFNLGNMVGTATLGAYLFGRLGGRVDSLADSRTWLILVSSMGLIYVGNAAVAAVAMSLYKRGGFAVTWLGLMNQVLPSFVVLGFVGVALTLAYLHWGNPTLMAVLVLIILLHYALRQYTAILQERAVTDFLTRSESLTGNWRAHTERVVGYVTAIANELGLKRPEQTLLRYAAWLHDVAHWDRRLQVLSGGQTPASVDRVDSAVRGAAAVAALAPLVPVATMIRQMGERYDGKGGPDGLAGEGIPIGSRILAVAERIDQLIQTPDRPATMAEVLARLREEGGKDLCPSVVTAVASLAQRNDPALIGARIGVSPEERARDTRRLAEQLRAILGARRYEVSSRQVLGGRVKLGPRFYQSSVGAPSLFTLYELGQVLNSSLHLERVLTIVSEVAEELTGVNCRVVLEGKEGSTPSPETAATADRPTVTIPMVSRGRRVGSLVLIGTTGQALGDRQLDLLSIVAGQAALAVENAKLYSEMEVRLSEISEMKAFTDVVLNSLTTGVIVCDERGRVTLTTKRAREIIRSLNYDAGPTPELERVLDPMTGDLLRQTINGGTKGFQRYPLEEPWGLGTVELHTSPLRDAAQKTGAVAIIHDVTERVRLEDQMQRVERLSILGELAASAAHEIRNPLTSIRGFVQLLMTGETGPGKAGEYFPIIIREIDRIDGMLKEMLALTRRTSPNLTICDLPSILDETLQLLENEAFIRRVAVVRDYSRDLPAISADRDQIKQVFLNLCTNALQAMPKGGELRVEAHVGMAQEVGQVTAGSGQIGWDGGETGIVVKVSDTGVGIPREYLGRIFDPFFTTKEAGTGLGLVVSFGILESHRGRISVESTLGKGSGFTVWLRGA